MKGFTKQGMYSVQTLIAAIITSSVLVFSAGVSAETQKPMHTQAARTAPIASVINLNKADVQTLAQLNGVGEKKAQAIIAYRESNGGFKTVDELVNVKGIGEKILEKNRALLSVN